MEVGTRVRYIRIDTKEDRESGFYPPIGTFGTVTELNEYDMRVKWDSGTIDDGNWWCDHKDVEKVDVYYDELVDKIARFFEEDEENWVALQRCWIVNHKSHDLRRLLQGALKG